MINAQSGAEIKPTVESQIGSVRTEQLFNAFRIELDDISIFNTIFNKGLYDQLEDCKKQKDTEKQKELEAQIEQKKKGFKKFLNILEILGMFFTNVCDTKRDPQQKTRTLEYEFTICVQEEENETEQGTTKVAMDGQDMVQQKNIYLEAKSRYACFNILNFVVNSFAWKEYLNAIHGGLGRAVTKWEREMGHSTVNNKMTEWIQECSLADDFLRWSNEYGDCAIPFQHFDLTYNVLKRQGDATDHGLPERADVSEFYKCCEQVYQNIQDALLRQDEKYMNRSRFAEAFKENPFIKTFRGYKDNDEFTAALKEMAAALIRETSALRRDDDIFGGYLT